MRLDRPQGHAGGSSDFRVAHAFTVCEDETQALRWPQTGQRCCQIKALHDVRTLISRGEFEFVILNRIDGRLEPSCMLEPDGHGDLAQPAAQRLWRAQLGQSSPLPQKRLLGKIVSCRRVAAQSSQQAPHHALLPPDQFLECRIISGTRQRDQRAVVGCTQPFQQGVLLQVPLCPDVSKQPRLSLEAPHQQQGNTDEQDQHSSTG